MGPSHKDDQWQSHNQNTVVFCFDIISNPLFIISKVLFHVCDKNKKLFLEVVLL